MELLAGGMDGTFTKVELLRYFLCQSRFSSWLVMSFPEQVLSEMSVVMSEISVVMSEMSVVMSTMLVLISVMSMLMSVP